MPNEIRILFFDLQELQLTDAENGQNESFDDGLNMGESTIDLAANAESNEFNQNSPEISPSEKVFHSYSF